MKRGRGRRPRRGSTLADALSPELKTQLHLLRRTLAEQARAALASQLAEARPPWRRPRRSAISPKARRASGTGAQTGVAKNRLPRDRQKSVVDPTPRPPRRLKVPSLPPLEPFEYWDFPSEAVVREPPPTSVSDADRARFVAHLRAGIDPANDGGEDLFVILGLDFGTSSTKMIVRLPYEAGEPTIAIPAPAPCRSGDDPYLWQTVLWLQGDGAFHPWSESGATVLNALKQGLIQGRAAMAISTSGALEVTRTHAGVAYLAFVIRYVRGWLRVNRSDLFRGRRPVWFVNVGMPTASYDDPRLAKPYRRIAAAALQLAKIDSPVTLEAVKLFLDDPHVVEAGATDGAAEALGVAVFPEAAAGMTGFAKSARNAPGLYLLVDVGAMTLDACMFRLNQHVSEADRYAFMAAQVRPLGVDSFHWFLAEGKTESGFIEQCQRTLNSVVWETRRRRDPNAETWKLGNDVPVFLTGGGAANRLHQDVVESVGAWLKRDIRNDGIRRLELPVPATIVLPEPLADFGRMAVAWGLSCQPTDIGRIDAMSDIDDIGPPKVVDSSDSFVSKDQV